MKSFWKIVKWFAILAVSLFVVCLGFIVWLGLYHRPIQKADAIIILGAAINTPALYNRSLEGLRLYQAGYAPVLVLAGGVDYPGAISEAKYMEKVILESVNHQQKNNPLPGPPPEGEGTDLLPKMFLDEDSHSTFENIQNAKKLIPDAKSVIIVSDSFHLARGVLVAKAAGFSPVYWSSPEPTYYRANELIFYYFREAAAMIDYLPKFLLH